MKIYKTLEQLAREEFLFSNELKGELFLFFKKQQMSDTNKSFVVIIDKEESMLGLFREYPFLKSCKAQTDDACESFLKRVYWSDDAFVAVFINNINLYDGTKNEDARQSAFSEGAAN